MFRKKKLKNPCGTCSTFHTAWNFMILYKASTKIYYTSVSRIKTWEQKVQSPRRESANWWNYKSITPVISRESYFCMQSITGANTNWNFLTGVVLLMRSTKMKVGIYIMYTSNAWHYFHQCLDFIRWGSYARGHPPHQTAMYALQIVLVKICQHLPNVGSNIISLNCLVNLTQRWANLNQTLGNNLPNNSSQMCELGKFYATCVKCCPII